MLLKKESGKVYLFFRSVNFILMRHKSHTNQKFSGLMVIFKLCRNVGNLAVMKDIFAVHYWPCCKRLCRIILGAKKFSVVMRLS